MILSISLFAIAASVYLSYFFVDVKKIADPKEFYALLVGLALMGIIMSIEAIFLNIAKMSDKTIKKWKPILGLVLAIIALTSFLFYIGMRFSVRMWERGISFI